MDLNALFPVDKSYVTYSGSLTTPTCNEGVAWHVFVDRRDEMNVEQLADFQNALSIGEIGTRINNRNVQPINNRTLFISEEQN